MRKEKPPIITFLSGKGGVGKTIIAANVAHYLASKGLRVLLLDFDMYNRGLSALLKQKISKNEITVYSLITSLISKQKVAPVLPQESEIEIRNNLFFIPSTLTGELVDWPEFKTKGGNLRRSIEDLLQKLTNFYRVDCLIIDVSAGPSPLNINIAGSSTMPVIVSEADPVTWDGTLNFRSYITRDYPEKDIFFIINKVSEKFDIENLNYAFKGKLELLFKNLRIISYIPFEYKIFESFGSAQFAIEEYKYSTFARKIEIISYDIIKETKPMMLRQMDITLQEVRKMKERVDRAIHPKLIVKNIGIIYAIAFIIIGFFLMLWKAIPEIDVYTFLGGTLFLIGGSLFLYFILSRRR